MQMPKRVEPICPICGSWTGVEVEKCVDSDKSCIIVCKQCKTIFALSDYQIVTEDKDDRG